MRLTLRLRRQGAREGWSGVRLLVAAVLAALAVGFLTTGSAHAYPCITRASSADRVETDERCRPQRRKAKAGKHSSFAELAFAGGIFVAVLLLPFAPKNLDVWNDYRAGRGRF